MKKLTKHQREMIEITYHVYKFFESMQQVSREQAKEKFIDEIENIVNDKPYSTAL